MSGQIVVVTGAARGLGAATAAALADEGWTVIATDLADTPPAYPPEVIYRSADVTDAGDWATLSAWLAGEHGYVHALVNNAGLLSAGRVGQSATLAEWDRVMHTNAKGPLLGMSALVPLMPPGSSIVNIVSTAGLTGHYRAAYTAGKWALRGLTKCAAVEFGPKGIRVNAVMPGMLESAMTAGVMSEAKTAQLAETPLGRVGSLDEAVAVIRFLLSTDASYVSGAEITVDGGATAHGGVKSISDAASSADGDPPRFYSC